jgi:hypothetical protein
LKFSKVLFFHPLPYKNQKVLARVDGFYGNGNLMVLIPAGLAALIG